MISRIGRVLFAVAGVALVLAACVVVFGDGAERAAAIELARNAQLNAVVAVTLLPLANLAISAAVFHVLYRRFGRVGYAELVTLMGSAWLLNYLPMRPGMLGRIAYHRQVNGIDIRHSVRTLVESMASSFVAAGLGLAMCQVADSFRWTDASFTTMLIASCVGACLLGLVMLSWSKHAGAILVALGLRITDLAVWMLRYIAAFSIAGHPVSAPSACMVACASQAATAFALWGNGLGVREWSVGITGAGLLRGAGTAVGLTADIVNRVAELITALPLGVVCTVVAARNLRRAGMSNASRIESTKSAGNDQ